jgi:signal transduction histidine kinase
VLIAADRPDPAPDRPEPVRPPEPAAHPPEPAPRPDTPRPRHFAALPIPTAGDVALGFEFARAADAQRVAERLPPTLARHAAVALALVTTQLATEREVASLRAREEERASFVSTVAHELRTPLTGLRGYLELILGGGVADPDVEREFLERSRAIVGSMGELVGDLLEISRLESGTLGLEIGPFSLAEACSQVAASLLPIAIERRIRLTTSLPVRLRVARADRRRVEQIVTNLAANALKFTPSDGNVEIAARFEGLVAIVVVRDDGPGIPSDDRSRIFERFHRMAGHERITGTGLGLPIARDLARQMLGDLGVASVPGAGSAFVLALPGPAEVDPDVVATALEGALALEEQILEERAVRRAIEAGRVRASTGHGRADEEPTRIAGTGRLRALPSLRDEAPSGV